MFRSTNFLNISDYIDCISSINQSKKFNFIKKFEKKVADYIQLMYF
jgi:hypothetical protein